VDLLENGVEADSLVDIFHSVSSLASLKTQGAVQFGEDLSGVVQAIFDLMDSDGTFRAGSKEEQGSALNTGYAYHALALLKKHFALSPEVSGHIGSVAQTVDAFFSGNAREDDGMLEFTDANDPLANLQATSLVWTGANALAAVTAGVDITEAQIGGLAEYFLHNKHVTNTEDAHYLLTALRTVANNSFNRRPLAVTLSKSSVLTSSKGDEGLIKILVTDVFGQFATNVGVYVVKVSPADQEKQIILRNQQALPASDNAKNIAYSFNFLATKPDQGFYSMELSVSPVDKSSPYAAVEETTRIIKVVAVVELTEATLQISDSKEQDESFASNPLSLQYPNKLADVLRATSLQTILFSFRAQASGRPVSAHQVFLRFTNLETKHEAVFVAEQHGKKYKFSVNIKDQLDAFQACSGKYAVTLVVGDSLIQNPVVWELATLNIQFGKLQREPVSEVSSGPLPEIVHQFRAPDKRPPPVVSFVFTGLVLAPFFVFLIGLLYVGANLRNFPLSNPKSLFFAAGFQACVGSIFGLFVIYWLRLTMVQTLCYLLALALVTTWRPQHTAARKRRTAKDARSLPATSGRGEEIRGAEALEMASKQA